MLAASHCAGWRYFEGVADRLGAVKLVLLDSNIRRIPRRGSRDQRSSFTAGRGNNRIRRSRAGIGGLRA